MPLPHLTGQGPSTVDSMSDWTGSDRTTQRLNRLAMYDDLEIRCPRLGGGVTFAYCQQEGGDLPCPRILACWQLHFDVGAFLKERLSEAEWDRCFNRPPKDKMTTLIEMIEAAKKRRGLQE